MEKPICKWRNHNPVGQTILPLGTTHLKSPLVKDDHIVGGP